MRLIFSKCEVPWKGAQAGEEFLEKLERNLEINKLTAALSLEGKYKLYPNDLLKMMTSDYDEIIARQMVSRDLMENEEFFHEINSAYAKLRSLHDIATDVSGSTGKDVSNYIVIIKWLEIYISIIIELRNILEKHKETLHSQQFQELRIKMSEMVESSEFSAITKNLKFMKMENVSLKSARLGINLNEYLEPESINCLEVNSDYYYPRKIINSNNNTNKRHGISKFIYKPRGNNTQAGLRYDESQPSVAMINTNKLQRLVSCEVDIEFINSLGQYFNDLNFNSRTAVRNFIRDRINFIR